MIAPLDFRRYEFKYHVRSAVAAKLLPALLNHMSWDDYVRGSVDKSYPVYSVYYDNYAMKSYWEKIDGEEYRKKYRVRTYEPGNPAAPWFVEIKRKHGAVILKNRYPSKPGTIHEDLAGGRRNGPRPAVLEEFVRDLRFLSLTPKVLVAYDRRPLVGKLEKGLRVTFDCNMRAARVRSLDFGARLRDMCPGNLIIEVKYNDVLPHWLHSIIQAFGLEEQRYSKYCAGIEATYPTEGMLAD